MQVVFTASFIVFPAVFRKKARPVVGRSAVCTGPPYIIIAVGTVLIAAGLKPRMLVRGVVDHKIHHELNIALVCFLDKLVHIRHRTEFGVDVPVVADVIAVVCAGGAINRAEPDDADTQILKRVKVRDNSRNVTYTVSVAIREASRIYLIYDAFLPPSCHNEVPPK